MNPPEHFDAFSVARDPFPEFTGERALLYESPDGRIIAGAYWFKGRHSWVLPYDDYFYVIAGSAEITVDDQEPFYVGAGSFCHLHEGSSVTFDMSEDFQEVSVLVSDTRFDLTTH